MNKRMRRCQQEEGFTATKDRKENSFVEGQK